MALAQYRVRVGVWENRRLHASASRQAGSMKQGPLARFFLARFFPASFIPPSGARLRLLSFRRVLDLSRLWGRVRGVCGKAAQTQETQLVVDTHALIPGAEHIACDPNSASEIVVPVFNQHKELIAVFDVDSTEKRSFDTLDQQYLEELMHRWFATS